jgi:hypothetical protein
VGRKGSFYRFGGSRVAGAQSFADQLLSMALLCQEENDGQAAKLKGMRLIRWGVEG